MDTTNGPRDPSLFSPEDLELAKEAIFRGLSARPDALAVPVEVRVACAIAAARFGERKGRRDG